MGKRGKGAGSQGGGKKARPEKGKHIEFKAGEVRKETSFKGRGEGEEQVQKTA